MPLIEVTPSGTVGKQVYATNKPVKLCSVVLTTSSLVSGAIVTIRDGNASGTRVLQLNVDKKDTVPVEIEERFDKGMHVKVIGAGAVAYLIVK